MESKKLEKPRKNGAFSTRQAVTKPDEETGGVSLTQPTFSYKKCIVGTKFHSHRYIPPNVLLRS